MFLDSSAPELTISSRSCLALSITVSFLAERMFSIRFTLMIVLQGPILSIVSYAAPITAVLTWSIEEES